MVKVTLLHKHGMDLVGFIPTFLSENDPRPAREQFNTGYIHGGGWRPFDKFAFNPQSLALKYPGDPPMQPVAKMTLRDEQIYVYPYAWVLILQKDGSHEIARMD